MNLSRNGSEIICEQVTIQVENIDLRVQLLSQPTAGYLGLSTCRVAELGA